MEEIFIFKVKQQQQKKQLHLFQWSRWTLVKGLMKMISQWSWKKCQKNDLVAKMI